MMQIGCLLHKLFKGYQAVYVKDFVEYGWIQYAIKKTSVETEVEPKLTAYEKDLIYSQFEIMLEIQLSKKSTFSFFLFGDHKIFLEVGELENFNTLFVLPDPF